MLRPPGWSLATAAVSPCEPVELFSRVRGTPAGRPEQTTFLSDVLEWAESAIGRAGTSAIVRAVGQGLASGQRDSSF